MRTAEQASVKGTRMGKRKDGIETRGRILTAACEIFAQKGFHDAKVEEICKRAQTNIAAINYYFGSKDQLYAKVWRHAFEKSLEAYPPEGGVSPDAPPEQRLRGTIRSLVGRAVNPGRIGDAGRLLLLEMVTPTGVIEQVKHDAIRPMHERLSQLMRDLLGPQAGPELILLSTLSVVHQCMAIGIRLFMGKMPPFVKLDMPPETLEEKLADHITRFSAAAIEALYPEVAS
jgi:AcrR family transcriptional regulator